MVYSSKNCKLSKCLKVENRLNNILEYYAAFKKIVKTFTDLGSNHNKLLSGKRAS